MGLKEEDGNKIVSCFRLSFHFSRLKLLGEKMTMMLGDKADKKEDVR